MSRLFIITAQHRMAVARAVELGLSPNEYVSITSMRDAEKLMGVENPRVEYYGDAPHDLLEIESVVRSRMR